MTRIALLIVSKDEGDMLELNIRHHLAWGIDEIGVADNCSGDDTQQRLRQFGERVTTEVFDDFMLRQHVRMRLLERIQARVGGAIEWAGVADTDEFFWAPGVGSIRDLLALAPPDVVCVTFHQKLFLPAEVDPVDGSPCTRQTYRTTGPESPLHLSYSIGKSFYRTRWLRNITSEHRCSEVPHAEWTLPFPVVHHYMIRDEDQFVMKVRRLSSWERNKGLDGLRWWRALRRGLGVPTKQLQIKDFKREWWAVWQSGGERAVRKYYQEKYRVQAPDLPRLLAENQLMRDTSFAEYCAANAR